MNSQRETYSSFEEFWENANRRLTDFNEKQARMIWQAATEQGVGEPVMFVNESQVRAMKRLRDNGVQKSTAAMSLYDEYMNPVPLYTHPPTGGGVPDAGSVVCDFLDRLGLIAERLYNYDPKRGAMVSGDIKAIGAELIDISEPLKTLLATQQPPERGDT